MQISELKAGTLGLIKENSPKIFAASVIFVVITAILSQLQFLLPAAPAVVEQLMERLNAGETPDLSMLSDFRPAGVALAVVITLILPVVDTGFRSYCLKISRGQDCNYKDVFNGFLFFTKIITIFILMGILILLLSMLFFFPALYPFYKFRMAYYILLDDPSKSAIQCMRESSRLMKGHKFKLFLLDLSFIFLFFLDILVQLLIPIPFPVVRIWLLLHHGLSRAVYYNQLIGYKPEVQADPA